MGARSSGAERGTGYCEGWPLAGDVLGRKSSVNRERADIRLFPYDPMGHISRNTPLEYSNQIDHRQLPVLLAICSRPLVDTGCSGPLVASRFSGALFTSGCSGALAISFSDTML